MSFFKDSAKVFSGTIAQRVISFLTIPIIARLFGPKEYGIFQVALSICAIFSIVGSLSLEASIAVADSKRQAGLRAICTSIIGLLGGMLFWAIIQFIQPYLSKCYSREIVKAIHLMCPFIIPLQIISLALRNYVGYLGKFKFHAVADSLSPVVNLIALSFSYFLLWRDYRSLIIGTIFAMAFQLAIFGYASRIGELLHVKIITIKTIFREFLRVQNFVKFYLPSNFLNIASVQLPVTLMGLVFPESVIGLFTMARRIISIPTQLTGRAIGQVFYPRAAKEYKEGRGLSAIVWQGFLYNCQLALFPSFFIASTAIYILPVILGPRWNGVALYIALLLPMVVVNAIQTSIGIGFIFSILNQQYKILWGNLLFFFSRFLPLGICLLMVLPSYITVLAYSVGSGIGYSLLLIWIFITVSLSLKKVFYTWIEHCLLSGLCILPILLCYFNQSIIWILGCIAISILLYCLIGWFKFLNKDQRSFIIFRLHKYFSFKR